MDILKNIKIIDLNKICRICLSEKGQMKSLFDSLLDSMIESVANIEIHLGDGLPELICFQCVLQVSRTFRFKKQCEKSDEILRHYINNKINENCNIAKENDITKEINYIFENNDNNENVLNETTIINLNSSSVDNLNKSFDNIKDNCSNNQIKPEIEQELLKRNNFEIDNSSKYVEQEECNSTNNNKYNHTILNNENELDSKKVIIDYSCEICSKIFKKRKSLLRHIKIHNDNNKQYKCTKCDKKFIEKSNLTKHMKMHTGELRNLTGKSNLCTICGKSFKWSSSLSKHMQYHTKNKIYKCSYCPKFYVEKRTLDIHIRNHTGDKPFKCNQCDKSFTQLCNLNKHLNIHTNVKLYNCKICNKKFSQSGYIKIHMRSHTGEKPYQCQECGKCFSSSSNLIIHKKQHSNEQESTLSCHIDNNCNKEFVETALIHKRIHNNDNDKLSYQCTNCLKYFKLTNQHHKESNLMAVKNIDNLICEICNKNNISNCDLKDNSKIDSDDKYQCIICDEKFQTILEHDAHQQQAHTSFCW